MTKQDVSRKTTATTCGDGGTLLALRLVSVTTILALSLVPLSAQETSHLVGTQAPPNAVTTPVKKPAVVAGSLIIPDSSQINAEDIGLRAHTNVRLLVPATASPLEAPPYSGYAYETPASLACIYGLVAAIAGCNPNVTVATPTGGSQTIAIVDAFHDPEAAPDLAYFSDQFGLPFSPAKFQVIYASGAQPPMDVSGGWEIEESLDIEYAHAMAPNAMLYLVEAASNSFTDLFTAVDVATNLVRCGKTTTCPAGSTGKGEVSMSWGGGEFSTETGFDSHFTGPNVVYFASAGDGPGTIYPSVSPNVIAAGGTSTARSLATGNLIAEIGWSDAGGGLSYFEPRPAYQAGIAAIAGTHRAVPDISSDANPSTGVWVYDTSPVNGYFYTWWLVGGTSVSSPTLAGIINSAATSSGIWAASSAAELTKIYGDLSVPATYAADFHDITYGACDYYSSAFSGTGYDLCTGVGSPKGLAGK
jgi:kumamolisin